MHATLIDAGTVAAHLRDPDWAVLDCRFDLARPQWGAQSWAEGHLPGALHADLERDLAGPAGPATGRHPLPGREAFAARCGAWGIDARVQVVAYDQGSGAWAARLWWLLRWVGHPAVAVLDGGIAAWQAAGLPVTAEVAARPARRFEVRPPQVGAVDAEELAREVPGGGLRLVDARAAERFAGASEPIDPVAGHVPGAVNHPFTLNLDASGRFLAPERLRERWLPTLGGQPPERVAVMCGSGVTACHDLLALEHAGLTGARLYPGSWSEWIRDPQRPVAHS